MSDQLKQLSEAVAAAREAKGWSRPELAFHAKLAEATVFRLESGIRAPSPRAQKSVEQALGWEPGTIATILGGTPGDGGASPPPTASR